MDFCISKLILTFLWEISNRIFSLCNDIVEELWFFADLFKSQIAQKKIPKSRVFDVAIAR